MKDYHDILCGPANGTNANEVHFCCLKPF